MLEVFGAAVAPLVADALVQTFGEGFGEAVGEGLGHDGVVVVVLCAEAVAKFLEANAAGDGECADVVGEPCFLRRDEVGEGAARLASFLVRLLAQEVESLQHLCARFVRVEFDVVDDGVGREEAVDAARGEEASPRRCDPAARWLRRRAGAPARLARGGRGCAGKRPSAPRCGRRASSR